MMGNKYTLLWVLILHLIDKMTFASRFSVWRDISSAGQIYLTHGSGVVTDREGLLDSDVTSQK